jgi:hypothetical protein
MRAKVILAVAIALAMVTTVVIWQWDDDADEPGRERETPTEVAGPPGEPSDSIPSPDDDPARRAAAGRARPGADGTGATDGSDAPGPSSGCTGGHLCVGAAKAAVTPDVRFIDGVVEPRMFVGTRLQRFNLGGFGLNPLQGTPDPDGSINAALNEPAGAPLFTGAHGPEPISVRAVVVQEPGGDTIAFVTLDATGAGNVIQARLTGAVAEATGIPAANVLFGQTHTHAGPDLQGLWGGVPQEWIETTLYPRAVEVVEAALRDSRPAELDVRSGDVEGHNRYRRPRRIDPDIEADPIGTLLRARDARTGAVIADLLQFSAHPTAVDEPLRVPHADYILGALDWLERDGGVAVYFNGPIADASASGGRDGCEPGDDGTYGSVRCRGEGIAEAILSFPSHPVAEPTLAVRHQDVVLPVTNPLFVVAGGAGAFNRYYDFLQIPVEELPLIGPDVARGLIDLPQLVPTARTAVSRITIGGTSDGVELVTIPGEATGTFGSFVRGLAAPGAHVMLLGLTHNSFGYIIPEEEFSYVDASGEAGLLVPFTGYEEFVSLGPLTAPVLRATGYVPLFDADPALALPPYLTACFDDVSGNTCLLHVIGRHLDYVQTELEANCLELGGPESFCSMLNPDLPLQDGCKPLAVPSGVCDLVRRRPGGGPSSLASRP